MARVLGSGDLQAQTIISTLTADGPSVVVPDAALLFSAEFIRSGDDLWLQGPDGSLIVIKDYFVQGELPLLLSPDGAMLTPDVVAALVGPLAPGQYAQLLLAQAADPIGQVESVLGLATAVRVSGETVTLNVGDPVFQGDVIQTGAGAQLGITFVDGTVFSISDSARMVLQGGTANSVAIRSKTRAPIRIS